MSPCCGRPNNRVATQGAADYYSRFPYLTSAQKQKQRTLGVSNCSSCAALTVGDPCAVCGAVKIPTEDEEVTP